MWNYGFPNVSTVLWPSPYRVSTDKQGKSGLGLDAQRRAVAGFVAGRGEIVAEHTEIESTRNKRPELLAALEACRKHKTTLLVAAQEHNHAGAKTSGNADSQ